MNQKPLAACNVPAILGQTIYPEPFAQQVSGRAKRKLGNVFGLSNFGVNQTELEPGAVSALAHQLANKSAELVVYLEIGDRTPLDEGAYPNDDLTFKITADGTCLFAHKDGTPY